MEPEAQKEGEQPVGRGSPDADDDEQRLKQQTLQAEGGHYKELHSVPTQLQGKILPTFG